ncbi:unnamed protein product [Trichogramma brassicae]|uniref:Uncharacterized protein n=1 Tax=Trichogramma brassicae TaxID=86971 RepID=A0A6H5IPN2_9HYME|nr:unnamed protein product [Trichogramma brassicae]
MPHFDYACLALIDISASLDIKLRRLLNACIRYIFQLPSDAALRPYYTRLDWLLSSQRRDYFLNILTFKVLNGLCPDYISNLYHWTGNEVRRSARIAGGAPTIEVPFADSSTLKSGFFIRAANAWNALPAQLRSSGSLASFKSLLGYYLRRHHNAQ